MRNLTDHINTISPIGIIKFTYEEEEDKQIPFLDTLLLRREDESVKLLVYRKKSHTDQYLTFSFEPQTSCNQNSVGEMLQHCDGRG